MSRVTLDPVDDTVAQELNLSRGDVEIGDLDVEVSATRQTGRARLHAMQDQMTQPEVGLAFLADVCVAPRPVSPDDFLTQCCRPKVECRGYLADVDSEVPQQADSGERRRRQPADVVVLAPG